MTCLLTFDDVNFRSAWSHDDILCKQGIGVGVVALEDTDLGDLDGDLGRVVAYQYTGKCRYPRGHDADDNVDKGNVDRLVGPAGDVDQGVEGHGGEHEDGGGHCQAHAVEGRGINTIIYNVTLSGCYGIIFVPMLLVFMTLKCV